MFKHITKVMAIALASVVAAMPASASAYYFNFGSYSGSWSPYRTTYNPYSYSNYNNYNSYTKTPAYSTPSTSTASVASTSTNTATASTSGVASVEQTLLSLLNRERTKYGLRPLQADSTLTNLARLKSKDMVAKNYFSHTSPTYGSPSQMLSRYGVRYSQFGENIAKGADAYRIHAMWMASSGHRANILKASFTHVGIGVAPSSSGYTGTQLFITR